MVCLSRHFCWPILCNSWTASATPKSKLLGLGWSAFARRYLRSLGWFPFLQVLRCFSSLRWLVTAYAFSRAWHHLVAQWWRVAPLGDPGINGCLTPAPGISQPTTSFIASWRLDIHHAPLIAWPHHFLVEVVSLKETLFPGRRDLFEWSMPPRSLGMPPGFDHSDREERRFGKRFYSFAKPALCWYPLILIFDCQRAQSIKNYKFQTTNL